MLTVSNGQTTSAQVGWVVVGVGVGGSAGNIFPVAGCTTGVTVENSSGQDELDPIDTSTTPTTSKTPSSTSRSKSRVWDKLLLWELVSPQKEGQRVLVVVGMDSDGYVSLYRRFCGYISSKNMRGKVVVCTTMSGEQSILGT